MLQSSWHDWLHILAQEEGLLIGKLDITKAFDSTELQVAEAVATSFAGLANARATVGTHCKGVVHLKIPAYSMQQRAGKPHPGS